MTLYVYHNGKDFVSFTEDKLKELNQPTVELITYKEENWVLFEKRVYVK